MIGLILGAHVAVVHSTLRNISITTSTPVSFSYAHNFFAHSRDSVAIAWSVLPDFVQDTSLSCSKLSAQGVHSQLIPNSVGSWGCVGLVSQGGFGFVCMPSIWGLQGLQTASDRSCPRVLMRSHALQPQGFEACVIGVTCADLHGVDFKSLSLQHSSNTTPVYTSACVSSQSGVFSCSHPSTSPKGFSFHER